MKAGILLNLLVSIIFMTISTCSLTVLSRHDQPYETLQEHAMIPPDSSLSPVKLRQVRGIQGLRRNPSYEPENIAEPATQAPNPAYRPRPAQIQRVIHKPQNNQPDEAATPSGARNWNRDRPKSSYDESKFRGRIKPYKTEAPEGFSRTVQNKVNPPYFLRTPSDDEEPPRRSQKLITRRPKPVARTTKQPSIKSVAQRAGELSIDKKTTVLAATQQGSLATTTKKIKRRKPNTGGKKKNGGKSKKNKKKKKQEKGDS